MNAKIIVTIVALMLAAIAAAQIRTVQLAHEVPLSNLRLPQSVNGTLGFKPCDDCEYQTERVTAATRWTLDGRNVSLDDFRLGVARVADRELTYVTVLHHLEQDEITAVSVAVQ